MHSTLANTSNYCLSQADISVKAARLSALWHYTTCAMNPTVLTVQRLSAWVTMHMKTEVIAVHA